MTSDINNLRLIRVKKDMEEELQRANCTTTHKVKLLHQRRPAPHRIRCVDSIKEFKKKVCSLSVADLFPFSAKNSQLPFINSNYERPNNNIGDEDEKKKKIKREEKRKDEQRKLVNHLEKKKTRREHHKGIYSIE